MKDKTLSRENIIELIDGLTPFPEDIFVPEQSWLKNNLLPLISIDLGLLREDLQGTVVHILNPVEVFDGYIGMKTEAFHSPFCGVNWFAFELSADNQYRFLAEEGYFLSSPLQKGKNHDDYFDQYVQERLTSYQKAKEATGKGTTLLKKPNDWPRAFLDRLGGKVRGGDWACTHPDPPSAFVMTDDDSPSISYQGNDFIYVAEVAGYNYCESGADRILLFYEPKSRIVLFSFEYT